MAEVGRALGAGLGRAALWLMPLGVIFEWVGGTFAKPLSARLAYLALLLGLYWLAAPARQASPDARWGSGPRWTLGTASLALGGALFACGAWWLFAVRLGGAPFAPPAWAAHQSMRLLTPLLAAWPLALGVSLCIEGRGGAQAYQRLGAFVALGMLMHLLAGVHVQGLRVHAASEASLYVLGAVLLVLALVRGPFALRMGMLIAIGLWLRGRGIAAWQLDPRVRDMLPLVHAAQDRFASGQHPYELYAMQHGSVLPLTYLPGLWLGYGLPRWLGLDLRWFGPLTEALLFVSLARCAHKVEPARRAWAEAVVFCFAAVWWFSPSVQWNAIYAEPTWWWALLGMTLTFSFAGPHWLGALLLGLALSTRHFAVVLAPFVIVYWWRARGLRAALPLVALAGGTACLLIAPFALTRPELFWFGTFRWLREYGPAHLGWFFDRFGFMQYFHEAGALHLLPYAQVGVVLAALVGACTTRRPSRIASFAATASISFIMLNVLLWDSFLLDGCVAAVALVVTAPLRAPVPVEQPSPRVFRASLAVLAACAVIGAWLGWDLVTTLHPRGRGQARAFLIERVREGDVVIDRSDRRLAFVEGKWLLRRDEVPAPIGGDFHDPAWGGRSATTALGRAWLVTQAGRDHALRDTFARAGRAIDSRSFGDYRVQAIEPARARALVPRVAGRPDRVRRCELGWNARDMHAVSVRAGAPVTLHFPATQPVLFAAGIPNQQVAWPRQAVVASAGGRSLVIENLHGLPLEVFAQGTTQITLRTDDPKPREVCFELSALEPR